MKLLKVLIVEDSEDDAQMLLRHLRRGGYEIEYKKVDSADEMEKELSARSWEIVISDYSMPQFDGLMALEILKKGGIDIPFIMISGTIGEDTAVQAMLAGVDDYFVKGNLNRLIPAIERELKEAENRRARKRAEKDLDDHKRRLQLALNASQMGVWEWNLQNDNVYWSPECEVILGTNDFGEKFNSFLKLVHPEDVSDVMNEVMKAVENHDHYKSEFRVFRENKEVLWMVNYGLAEYDERGKPVRLLGTIQDINERKKGENALREPEENLKALIKASTQYVWTANEDGSSREIFRWFSQLSGRSINTVTELEEIIHPEDRQKVKDQWFENKKQKTVFNMTIRFLNKSDEYCFMATRAVPMFNEDGSFRQWVGTCNDITERVTAEDELRKSEERFRSLISSSAQIVWTSGADGSLLTALTPAGEKLEVSNENLMEYWSSLIHPDEREKTVENFLRSIKNKTKYKAEYRLLSRNNEYRHYIARGTPVYEKDGTIREWVGTLTDITKAKLFEENLRKSEEQLRQAQKLESVGRLAGGIAHDFNNMLTAINGYSDLALRKLGENDPLRRNIMEIKKAGERSASLTQQLLAFSRRTILQTKVLDINEIVNETVVMFQRLIGEDIQIVSSLNPQIHKIKADAGQLSQMLLNLVVNARDAMPHGGTISIRTENTQLNDKFEKENPGSKKGNYVILSVADDGVGIDDETRQMIFEPFFTTKEQGKGTGLGLSTVYGIVNQMGGYIVVKSTLGSGSIFEIYLPSENQNDNLFDDQNLRKEPESGAETILLVEDEELVRNLSRKVLESCGYNVIEARDGSEAIDFCEKGECKIDLLLTDAVMPQMSGRDLAERIKQIYPTIKVLFTSEYIEDSIVRHGINEAETNFIHKPFSYEEISKKVRDLLDKK